MKTATKPKVTKPEAQTYAQWKEQQIQLGLDDLDAGRVISHEEFTRRSNARLKRLIKKHGATA